MQHRWILCTLLLYFAEIAPSYATNDHHCKPAPFKKVGNNIILESESPATPSIYFFTNTSNKSLFIDHPTGHDASAGWSSYLRPGHWSALSLKKSSFTLQCTAIEPGRVIPLHCSSFISVCIPSSVQTKNPKLKSNIWLTEDKPWENFVKALEGRGVYLTLSPK